MKLVIWDIDGTLVDSHAVIMASMDAGMAAAGLPPLPHAQVSTIVGLSLPIAIATLLPGASEAARDTVAEGYRTHYMTTRSAGESATLSAAGARQSDGNVRSTVADPGTTVVDKGPTTRDIVAAPEGDGQDARAATTPKP